MSKKNGWDKGKINPEQYVKFTDALKFVLKWEGWHSDHPNDPGGETYCGISRRVWPKWDGWRILDSLPDDEGKDTLGLNNGLRGLVVQFYRDNFWLPCSCHELPSAYAFALFDTAVNIGKGRACKMFQRFLSQGPWEGIKVDGIIGPETIDAAWRQAEIFFRGLGDFYMLRIAYYYKLAKRKRFQLFLRGWIARVVALDKAVMEI